MTEYRRNVAAVVLNDEGRILACRRTDVPDAWQLPQGGIEPGESEEAAVIRELGEEIGCEDVDLLGRLPHSIRYDWPPELHSRGWIGQEQIYFLMRIRPGARIRLDAHADPEFDAYEWMTVEKFLDLVSGFKAAAYARGLRELREAYPNISIR